MGSVNTVGNRPDQAASDGPAASALDRPTPRTTGASDWPVQEWVDDSAPTRDRLESETTPISDAARQRPGRTENACASSHNETDPGTAGRFDFLRAPSHLGDPASRAETLLDEWNDISALLVHPVLNEIGNLLGADLLTSAVYGREAIAQRSSLPMTGDGERFDDVIARAVEWCPGLSPSVLKGLLAQESGFDPTVINKYGYAGIGQIGRDEAREAGLQVGIAGSRMDERLNPYKAIPATARLLNVKAQRLGATAFSRYGQPAGVDFWNFVLAAYNGGEATVALAMGHAHRRGLAIARANSLVGNEAVSFARNYASRWDNLLDGGSRSPLGLAVSRYFPDLAPDKYREISSYPKAIIARSLSQIIGPR